ncbi:MAG: GNAT family N-acetyltransferase [Galactobacter sp.]
MPGPNAPRVATSAGAAQATPAQVDAYFESQLVDEPQALAAIRAANHAAGLPDAAVTPAQGKFLSMLIRLAGARRILEIGTLGGYSAAWMLHGLPSDGHLHSLEIDRGHAEVARANLASVDPVGEGTRWNVETGTAVKALHQLTWTRQAPFDLVFIDADKASNRTYLEWVLRLTAPGSLVVLDNVVRTGSVASGTPEGEDTQADVDGVREALAMMHNDPRFEATALQTLSGKAWDGFALALVTGAAAPGSVAESVRIERMSPATVRGALEVKNLGWRTTFSRHIVDEYFDDLESRLDADVASWTAALNRPGNLTRAAVALAPDGEVIGMASAAPVLEESDRLATGAKWELFTVYVDQSWQGSGVAKRLADFVLGDDPALLWVLEDNPRAREFFGKLGFVPDGAREELPPEWNGAADIRMVRRN